ncbi:MAG: TatD family hydrolase [bacterium]
MVTNFFETHAHLCDPAFDSDREKAIEASFAAGVSPIVEIACSPAEWQKALDLCSRHPGKIYCACGLHPHECDSALPRNLASLKESLKSPAAVAIGESGLDYFRSRFSRDEQLRVFSMVIDTANATGKPFVIHCRNSMPAAQNAYADVLAVLKKEWKIASGGRFSGVLHCFLGSCRDAIEGMDMGLALGVNGTLTYPKNNGLRETIRKAGIGNVVLETDCPYLPVQSDRGKRNDPTSIPVIARALGGLFGLSEVETADFTTRNALELFRL